jgi:hypothetical protein
LVNRERLANPATVSAKGLRTNAGAITDQQHPDHQFRINRRSTDIAVKWRKVQKPTLAVVADKSSQVQKRTPVEQERATPEALEAFLKA